VPTGLLIAAGVVAIVDWIAVYRRLFRVECVAKPLTLLLLLIAAATADLGPAHLWIVAALACGLVGDTALLFDRPDGSDLPFLCGLGAFLVGHVFYMVGFLRAGQHAGGLLVGAVVVVAVVALTLRPVLRGAARQAGRGFAALVAAYAGALGAMAVLGAGTGLALTGCGAVLFLVSDVALAWNRFVRELPHGPLLVIVTYHVGQALIVLGLVR
jgi:uncharacterized membrane protein YhhN